jgi:CheY-like chemotaxis protein
MAVHTVFLADESTTTRRVVELSFADSDVEVVAVQDGEEAIARLAHDRPDIILADIALPRRNGYDVAAFVKARPELAHIPVVLLAGALDAIDQTAVRASGCQSVLRKPFDPRQLSARVKNLLAGTADEDLGQCLEQLQSAFRDLGAHRVVEAGVQVEPVPESGGAEPIAVDTDGVPTLEELLGEISADEQVFSLDALPEAGNEPRRREPDVLASPFESAAARGGEGPAAPFDPATTEALVERITQRVLERMAEQIGAAARAAAARLLTGTAEGLIREEIQRLTPDS